MKVCMLAKHHSFLDARIFQKEAKSLLKKGYDVTLIVPKKNGFLYDIDGTPFTDGRFNLPSFTYQGVKVVPYDDRRERLEQMLGNVQNKHEAAFQDPLVEAGIHEDADVYHAHEFLSLYSGVGIKRALKASKGKHVKLIYDSHELTPDPLERKKRERIKLIQQILNYCLREVDHIITVSPSIKAWYARLNPSVPTELIYNSPYLYRGFEPKAYAEQGLTVCYEGLVHETKGSADQVLAITEACRQKMDFKFMIIGGERNGQLIEAPPHLREHLLQKGWVAHHTIPEHMQEADLGWLDFEIRYSLNRTYALPNKFFSYLNNGLPVIVNQCNDMTDFIRTHGCGLVIPKQTPTAKDYADAILYLHHRRELLTQMSQRARKVMETLYSWERMEQRLYNVYDRLLSTRTRYLF